MANRYNLRKRPSTQEDVRAPKKSTLEDANELIQSQKKIISHMTEAITGYRELYDSCKSITKQHEERGTLLKQLYRQEKDRSEMLKKEFDEAIQFSKTQTERLKEITELSNLQVTRSRRNLMNLHSKIRQGAPVRPWTQCEMCDVAYHRTDEMRAPRVLQCGHTLCQSCLIGILKDGHVKCPYDGENNLVRDIAGIKQLPKNRLVFFD